MPIDNLAETILEKLRVISQAETVVGKPIQAGNTSIIPVSRLSMGFGLGGGTKSDLAASGGGLSIEPVAFLAITGDDVRIIPVSHDSSIISKVADLVPDLVSAFRGKKEPADEV